jgi:fibronectin type 3 domain-containing protein
MKSINYFKLYWLLILTLVLGCTKEYSDPVSISRSVYPAEPKALQARIGDQTILLNWDVADPQGFNQCYIYRKDTLMTTFSLIDSTSEEYFKDENLLNGMLYSYQVTVRNEQGYTSSPSYFIQAKPNLYSIIINGGETLTNSRDVQLNIYGPNDTRLMQISNDSLFTGAIWETFANTKQWRLPDSSGSKNVYARFRDAQDNITIGPILDRIQFVIPDNPLTPVTLMVKAGIDSNALALTWGQSNHSDFSSYRLFRSKISDIANDTEPIFMTHTRDENYYTDTNLNDGDTYYYRLYVYNTLGEFAGSNIVSVTIPPKDSEPPISAGALVVQLGDDDFSLSISWEQSNHSDFSSYRLFRSKISDITNDTEPIFMTHTRDENYYTDTNLNDGDTYYYRLYVYNTLGEFAGSNIVSVTIPPKDSEPPISAGALIVQPGDDDFSLSISWEQSNHSAFSSYRLFRSTSSDLINNGSPIFITRTRDENYYTDSVLESATTYYYRLYVYDIDGNSAGSQIVAGTTPPNQPPQPVTLTEPKAVTAQSLQLNWNINRDADFDSYRIFRSKSAQINVQSAPIAIMTSQQTTTVTDSNLENSTVYYYQLFVYDKGGLYAGSNIVNATTLAQ